MTETPLTFGPADRKTGGSSGRPFRWAIWSCLLLGILGLVLLLTLGMSLLNTHKGRVMLKWADNVNECQMQRLVELSGALKRYHQDNGALPQRLDQVYPVYMKSPVNLRCPAEPSHAGGTSFHYRPWVEWGNRKAVLVYCTHHPIPPELRKFVANESREFVPVIRGDGSVDRLVADTRVMLREDTRRRATGDPKQ